VLNALKAKLPISRQCELLELPRTSQYYKKKEPDMEREYFIKEKIDFWHTVFPCAGARTFKKLLQKHDDMICGRKTIRKYMEEMGIIAMAPKPGTSGRNKEHKIYPYLLRKKSIFMPNQVWAIDITYIKMSHGFMYLTAVIDWHTRYIVGWALSDTLETAPVVKAVDDAIDRYGAPGIINSDQGSQFTSKEYTEYLKDMKIRQSMDGKDRWVDNVIVERWFRTLKWDDIYINEYNSPRELRHGIRDFIEKYNHLRPHSACDGKTPASVYLYDKDRVDMDSDRLLATADKSYRHEAA
jgi:putative transposase